jgi:hypothetical protein
VDPKSLRFLLIGQTPDGQAMTDGVLADPDALALTPPSYHPPGVSHLISAPADIVTLLSARTVSVFVVVTIPDIEVSGGDISVVVEMIDPPDIPVDNTSIPQMYPDDQYMLLPVLTTLYTYFEQLLSAPRDWMSTETVGVEAQANAVGSKTDNTMARRAVRTNGFICVPLGTMMEALDITELLPVLALPVGR